MSRGADVLRHVSCMWALVLAALWASQPATPAVEPLLTVSANIVDGRWLRPADPIELTLSRAVDARLERVAVTIGKTDWTGLFVRSGLVLRYQQGVVPQGVLPLPAGESVVTVYHVSRTDEWRSIGQWSMRVLTARGFERSEALPTLSLENKGQVAEAHSADAPPPPRATFQDASVTVGLRTAHVRNGVTATSQVNVLGVSNQPDAPRFQQAGTAAPKLDLTDYLLDIESRHVKVSVGHLLFNTHRHLLPRFASRGLGLTLRTGRADLTVAALNGNSIVGFDNLFGVQERANRLQLATVGVELTKQAGAARVEAMVLSGSRDARSGFAQGQINDVERGDGLGLRFASAAPGARLRFDAGLSRSRFQTPNDPLLANGATLVPLRARASDAAYLDAAYELLRPGSQAGAARPRSTQLTVAYRFELVDPLYRPLGNAPAVRADVRLHTGELSGAWGVVLGQVAHTWSHDNLGKVSSLLRTETGLTTATLAVPLGARRAGSKPGSPWWPLVTWTLNRTSQVGDGAPDNGGFASDAQVPDQRSTLNTLRSEWTFSRWRLAYAGSSALVDNRQPGRTTADFDTLAQTVSAAVTLSTRAEVGVEVGRERATSLELASTALTHRIGFNGNLRPTSRTSVTWLASRTALRDPTATRSDVDDVMIEGGYTLPLPWRTAGKPSVRVFSRWTWQSADVVQILFGTAQLRHNWALSTGLSLSVF